MRDSTEDHGALLGRCAPVILLVLVALAPAAARAAAASSSAAIPDFLWSNGVLEGKIKAAKPVLETPGAEPSLQQREVRDPLTLPRAIDLTKSPDDLWDRIRRGFAMPKIGRDTS